MTIDNMYGRGSVFELFQVTDVETRSSGKPGVLIHIGRIGSEKGTGTISDSSLTKDDVQEGDIARLELKGPSIATVTEVYREGIRVYPVFDSEQHRMIEDYVGFSELVSYIC